MRRRASGKHRRATRSAPQPERVCGCVVDLFVLIYSANSRPLSRPGPSCDSRVVAFASLLVTASCGSVRRSLRLLGYMAATALFSCHSSNPLEVHSSDLVLLHARMEVERLPLEYSPGLDPGSDDAASPSDYNLPQMAQYHSHLAQLYPHSASTSNPPIPSTSKTTLDTPVEERDMELEDEEMLSDQDEEMENVAEDTQVEEVVEVVEEVEEEVEEEEEEDDDTDEEMTMLLKPSEERAEIEDEMLDLEAAVPNLAQDYKLVDRLGTGTFSAVYKAIDLGYHTKWDNAEWHGHHPSTSSSHYQSVPHPPDKKAFVAVKRIYVTSGPERIRNEISIMSDCRGCRHVSQIITAFRHQDQVVVVMPYQRNDDFRVRLLPCPPVVCVTDRFG